MSDQSVTTICKDKAKALLHSSVQKYRQATSHIRCLPDFVIIGGQRCGTTSLYYYLLRHPCIAPSCTKEIHFFDYHFAQGLDWYRAQFPMMMQKYLARQIRKRALITGEASPSYIFHPHAPTRMAQLLPYAKIIVLLRNPVDRAYSHYWLETLTGNETLSFENALAQEQSRLEGEHARILADEHYYGHAHRHYSYLTRGIYADQLQHWMRYYPKEQFLILRSEDLYSNAQTVIKQTLAFLDVPFNNKVIYRQYRQYRIPTKQGHKMERRPPSMNSQLRQYLLAYFKPHNAHLAALIGQDFHWDV